MARLRSLFCGLIFVVIAVIAVRIGKTGGFGVGYPIGEYITLSEEPIGFVLKTAFLVGAGLYLLNHAFTGD